MERVNDVATALVAENQVVAEMAAGLLYDAGFEVEVISDDFVGIGGHPARPRLLCRTVDLEAVLDLLRSHGMV